MTSDFVHTPVLLPETVQALKPGPGDRFIDATLGGAGHAERILELTSPDGILLGIDADPAALAAARIRLARFGDRAVLVEAYYDHLGTIVENAGLEAASGALFDLGVSSHQLDQPERGFSFQHDAALDMRMGPSAGVTAAELVNTLPADELASLFRVYGEERYAGRIARRIVEARSREALRTTGQLAAIVASAQPKGRERIHPATRVFQALRIAVNAELDRLQTALPQAVQMLRHGGRLAVISFHSLEDRIVKHFMRREARGCICPPQIPTCVCGRTPTLRILTSRPITASEAEIAANPRARSAKLRVAETLAPINPAPGVHHDQ